MPTVCAIFTHFSSKANTLACLRHLAAQTHRPEHILVVNNSADDELTSLPRSSLMECCIRSRPDGTSAMQAVAPWG